MRIAATDNILLAFRMLKLLKVVFTFGKELSLFARVFQMSIRLLFLTKQSRGF